MPNASGAVWLMGSVRLNSMSAKTLCRCVAVSLIAAGPAGGFIFGLLNAGDPDPNPIGRLFYACIMAVVTPLHAGFPPHHEAFLLITKLEQANLSMSGRI